jgi:hypothetical protein
MDDGRAEFLPFEKRVGHELAIRQSGKLPRQKQAAG